jgi:hypothetical protein
MSPVIIMEVLREHSLANLSFHPSPFYLVILSDPTFGMYFSLCQKKNSLICPPVEPENETGAACGSPLREPLVY